MMSSLRRLLQDADPLRHEPSRLEGGRERVRLTILRTIPLNRSTRSVRARVTILGAFVIALTALSRSVIRCGYAELLQSWRPFGSRCD